MKRIQSIDFMRGFVMIIMALDHVRDMLHLTSINQSPTDLTVTTPLLFLTRWITYLCAPTFVFLAGASAFLAVKKMGDLSSARAFLLKRGLYLIALEFTVVGFGVFFDPGFHTLLFEVIAAIGFDFIILSFLLRLSPQTTGIIGLTIIFCHNLFPALTFAEGSVLKQVLAPLFVQQFVPMPNRILIVAYPPIPWLGIMLAGYRAGGFFELADVKKRKLFAGIGLSAIGLFIIVRLVNAYGDAQPWSSQKTSMLTFLSFMNVTKYPPSLVFTLVTLGIMFLILAASEGRKGRVSNIISVYGKVPLFYFLLHFYLIHIVMLAIMFLQGFQWRELDFASGTFGRPPGVESGLPLWAVYLIWVAIVAVLFKPCRWFGNFKSTHQAWWLKYL